MELEYFDKPLLSINVSEKCKHNLKLLGIAYEKNGHKQTVCTKCNKKLTLYYNDPLYNSIN
jgi:hypothetical protein